MVAASTKTAMLEKTVAKIAPRTPKAQTAGMPNRTVTTAELENAINTNEGNFMALRPVH
jgi:hypothetical protein